MSWSIHPIFTVHKKLLLTSAPALWAPAMNEYELTVTPHAYYLAQQSKPHQQQFAFAYKITIYNSGRVGIQLIARHWLIIDNKNQIQEVKGLGVVGQQPFLRPGEQFEYTSWALLNTPTGSMQGSYFCVAEDGFRFDAPIPEFALCMPHMLH